MALASAVNPTQVSLRHSFFKNGVQIPSAKNANRLEALLCAQAQNNADVAARMARICQEEDTKLGVVAQLLQSAASNPKQTFTVGLGTNRLTFIGRQGFALDLAAVQAEVRQPDLGYTPPAKGNDVLYGEKVAGNASEGFYAAMQLMLPRVPTLSRLRELGITGWVAFEV